MLVYFFCTAAEALFLYLKLVKVLRNMNTYVYVAMAVCWSKSSVNYSVHARLMVLLLDDKKSVVNIIRISLISLLNWTLGTQCSSVAMVVLLVIMP